MQTLNPSKMDLAKLWTFQLRRHHPHHPPSSSKSSLHRRGEWERGQQLRSYQSTNGTRTGEQPGSPRPYLTPHRPVCKERGGERARAAAWDGRQPPRREEAARVLRSPICDRSATSSQLRGCRPMHAAAAVQLPRRSLQTGRRGVNDGLLSLVKYKRGVSD